MADRTYSREEMEEIFRRAAEHTAFAESGADAIRYEDLEAAAREVGIDATAVAEIAKKVEGERALVAQRADEDEIVRRELAERRHRARRNLLTYTIVMAFLATLDWMTPGGPWAQWVALVWGLFVALGLGRAWLDPSDSDRERIVGRERKRRARRDREERRQRAASEWKSRLAAQQEAIQRELAQQEDRRRHQDRERREASRERERAGREFERAVEDGVTQLLTVVARRIGEAAREHEGPKGDFGAYVRREKQRASGVPASGPEIAKVRVAPPQPATERAEDELEEDVERRGGRRDGRRR
jgi:hypothetical protein